MGEAKSELHKTLNGELYLASDPELIALRRRARRLTRLFNQSLENETERRTEILLELFGKAGPKITIEPPFYCDYGSHIFANDDLYMNFGCVVLDCAEVHFGKSVLCGPYVQIYTASHPLDAELRAGGPELAKPIRIGNQVWIGAPSIEEFINFRGSDYRRSRRERRRSSCHWSFRALTGRVA